MAKKEHAQKPVLDHLIEKLSASGQDEKDNRIVPDIQFENPDADDLPHAAAPKNESQEKQTENTAVPSADDTEKVTGGKPSGSDRDSAASGTPVTDKKKEIPASSPAERTPNPPKKSKKQPQTSEQTAPAKPAPADAPIVITAAEDETDLSAEEKAEQRLENAELSFIDETKDNPYHNVFVESLETITADELGKAPKKKKKDPLDRIIDGIRTLVFWAAVVTFFISGYQVVFKLYSYHKADDLYSSMADNIFSEEAMQSRDDLVALSRRSPRLSALTPINGTKEESDIVTDTADNEVYNELFEMMKGQLSILQRKNEEVVGWIRMEGDTEINYPVVLHEDNEYYLHYAFDKSYNPAGSIFLDYRNKPALSGNRHSIIYGHNMESGSPMFANLLHYREDGYWDNNRYIDVYTEDALYTFEVFASYECTPSQVDDPNHAWRMNFKNDPAVFLDWISAVKERSDIHPDVEVKADARILTLSTCTNANDHRYVVHAVLTETVK